MVGPDYKRPEMPVPPVYRGADAPRGRRQPESYGDLEWWSVFPDPDLQALIRTAVAQNYDLRIAVARILQAQSQVTIARSQEFPTVDGSASAPYLGYTGADRPSTLLDNTFQPQAGFDVAWELDFWGKFRRNTESARADLLATDEGRYAVMATLVTQVADAYLTLRALDLTLEISQRTVTSRVQSRDLVQARLDGGVAGVLDLRQAETLLYGATKDDPRHPAPDRAAGKLHQYPARAESRPDQARAPARPADRRADAAPGPAAGPPSEAAGHPPGGAAAGFRKRADWRRDGDALSASDDIRIRRSRRREARQRELRTVRYIQRPAGDHPAYLQHGAPAGQRRVQRGGGPASGTAIPADPAAGAARSVGRTGRRP